jgi:hypothetical protein
VRIFHLTAAPAFRAAGWLLGPDGGDDHGQTVVARRAFVSADPGGGVATGPQGWRDAVGGVA